MPNNVFAIDVDHPDSAVVRRAADLIRSGELVAFPTETVYGLGANALSAAAVQRIFTAKGRAAANPVIVHVRDVVQARDLAIRWPRVADRLAEAFWPGPLTLVLAKCGIVPEIVTAGGPTVGLRVPSHPVALALLNACGMPLAAPSANRSTRISPTTAAHVIKDFGLQIPLVLDAGPTSGGLESTVLDLESDPPRVLRPGLISVEQIEQVLNCSISPGRRQGAGTIARSPGMEFKHYSPAMPVSCVRPPAGGRVAELLRHGMRVGWLALDGEPQLSGDQLIILSMPVHPAKYAARLYAALHFLEDAGVEQIVVSLPPQGNDWLAVHDRLCRAGTR